MKILVVENNVPSSEYLHDLLCFEGYDCQVASNGKEGLELYGTYKPDLILSDIYMPYMDGLTLLRKLRKEQSDVFFIIVTTHGNEKILNDAYKKGVNEYLIKPVDSDFLLRTIGKYATIIRHRQLQQEAEGRVISKFVSTHFPTNYQHIPVIVGKLVSEISAPIDGLTKSLLELSITELITNAIEHGNLEITYDEKHQSQNAEGLDKLIESRMKNPKFANRVVKVDYYQTEDSVEWIITDEGKGFKWNDVLDPTDSANILRPNGRGIFLTKHYVDEIEYLGKGNIVRIKKTCK